MARNLVFYRATVGVEVQRFDRGKPKGRYESWTVRSFSFWNPIKERTLDEKLKAVVEQMGYRVKNRIGYEEEEVSPGESRGIGFYRWDVIDEGAHVEVARIHRDYVMRPDGSEVRWRH